MPMSSRERGAALLTVLLLVTVLAALAVAALDQMRLSVRLAGNSRITVQSHYYLGAAFDIAEARIKAMRRLSPGKTTLAGGWNGRPVRFPVPGGVVTARLSDATHCFNLNSLVVGRGQGPFVIRPIGVRQFAALMQGLGLSIGEARSIAAAAADWIDSDDTPTANGGESEVYARGKPPYRTGNTLMAEVSELRAVRGITPEIYDRLRPWLCALPTTDLAPININTLRPDQARLVTMLLENQVPEAAARAMIEARPAAGWGGLQAFWSGPALSGISPDGDIMNQPKITTDYFRLDAEVDIGGVENSETMLIEARNNKVRLVERRWTADE